MSGKLPKPPKTYDEFSKVFPALRAAWDQLGDAAKAGPLDDRTEQRRVGAHVEGPGGGHAWGRRDWSDLPQRLDALATASGAPAAETPAAPPPEASASPSEPPPLPEAGAAPTEPPPQPNPVTTTSAALHLMQVPTSRLLEAHRPRLTASGVPSRIVALDDASADAVAEFIQNDSGVLFAVTAGDDPIARLAQRSGKGAHKSPPAPIVMVSDAATESPSTVEIRRFKRSAAHN